jgi:hypothetical protein
MADVRRSDGFKDVFCSFLRIFPVFRNIKTTGTHQGHNIFNKSFGGGRCMNEVAKIVVQIFYFSTGKDIWTTRMF